MSTTEILAGLIDHFTGQDGIHETVIPNLVLVRCSRPTMPLHGLHKPALCIIAQGRKRVILGDAIHHYDAARYLVASVDVPVIGQVIEASAALPYLCIRLDLDLALLSELALELGLGRGNAEPGPGLAVSPVTAELLDATARLVRLLGCPRDVAMLAPLAEREILYRLLTGEQGARLCQIAHAGSRLHQVNRAIAWIRANFDRPFRIEQVAAAAHMSASTLHEHFKAVTAMSPLQYQKQLRLQEARRLILSQAMDAATAGHSVGYESPSQFSREYSRLFGAPPIRDIARLRGEPFAAVAM